MRVLNRYLMHDYIVAFGMTLLVFTFVMSLGAVVKAIDLGARGVSGLILLQVFSFNIPYMLTFTLPMSVLTATLLLFGRLSFDGELTAMRASGMSLWQIIAPVVLLSIALSVACIAITAEVSPRARHAMRSALVQIGVEDPINLLEAGRFVRDFPGLMIYIGDRSGNRVTDVIVYETGNDGAERNVRAKHGTMRTDPEAKVMYIDLYEVRIDQREKARRGEAATTQYINASHYPVKLDFSEMQKRTVRRKVSDMVFPELLGAIRNVKEAFPELNPEDVSRQRMMLVVEANKRLALSLSCFAFTLLAIPLGMRSKRKESSVGIGISLLLVFFFYLFIIVANSLVKYPQYRPDYIVWIPVVASQLAGFVLLRRMR
ncbi:MAG TPA: LptF/LptG family permease [Kiritimatiellia bacterium]|nr:LptF/LptG family permease [Kiritimatiellia bacterium]